MTTRPVEVPVESVPQNSWMARAGEYSDKKIMNAEYLQALGLLAIAEALHRVAAAMETDRQRH
jgi:hypothetical protein